MSTPLHIIGAGGAAVEIKWAALCSDQKVAGFYVEDDYLYNSIVPVKPLADLPNCPNVRMICSIADTKARERIVALYKDTHFVNVIHPSAIFPEYLLGHGCYIGAGAVISPDVVIGSHVQIHNGAIIGHNTRIADCVTILPGAIIAGNCFVGYKALVGAGASVKEKLTIGAGAVIGMGAVVIRDVEEGATVAGVPAKSVDVGDPVRGTT